MSKHLIKLKKLKYQRQKDSMHCGVASLYMLCSIYGRIPNLEYLEEICEPSKNGISLKAIIDAANTLDMNAYAVRCSIEELELICSPAILHWNQNHFVVLEKIYKNKFKIADPAKGRIILTRKEFERHFLSGLSTGEPKGIAMLCKPSNTFYTNTKKENILTHNNNCKTSFQFLLSYVENYKRQFAVILLALIAVSLLQLILPFLTKAIVDVGIKNANISFIWLILFGELLIISGQTASNFLRSKLLLHISMRINVSLLSDFFIKLLELPMPFFDTKLIGDLMQRMDDHKRIQSFLTGQSLSILFNSLSFIIFSIVLFIFDYLIFIIFIIGSIIYGIWMTLFLKRRRNIDFELFELQAINQSKTYQFLTSIQEIKLQNCEKRRRWELEDVQLGLFDIQMKSLNLEQAQQSGAVFINEVKNILITIVSATAVINGNLSIGTMMATLFIAGQLNAPIESFVKFLYSLQDVKISLERITDIHKRSPEDNQDSASTFNFNNKIPAITLNSIFFSYNKHNPTKTINDISLNIPYGKTTAIVGASGSGKTTLIKLMLGYYSPDNGSVNIFNTNLKHLNKKEYRKICGSVMQDGIIFSESIANNIAIDAEKLDPVRIEEAAKIACIHSDIMAMPLKYETIIGPDGINLSQGQKQRILIARAVYRNPKFIFLDEATNSLDAKNERKIVNNLRNFYKKRTVVIIAHRLSTVCDADNIIVLDNGKICEQGTHNQLIENKRLYYTLIKNQLELGS